MSKRVVITTFGSFGDLNPYLGLALGLRARGHDPVIATGESYRHFVEAEGVEFSPIRPDHAPTLEGEANTTPGYAMMGKVLAFGYMKGILETLGVEYV